MTNPIHPNPIIDWYVNQKNRFAYGQMETALLFYPILLGGGAGVYVRMVCGYTEEDSKWITVLTVLAVGLFQWGWGWLSDRWGIVQADQEWRARRTETITEILKNVTKRGK